MANVIRTWHAYLPKCYLPNGVHCGLLVGPLPIVPLHSLEIPLYTESPDSFVASAAASIATGWSEPVPGRELHPLKSSAFHGALLRQQPTTETSLVMKSFHIEANRHWGRTMASRSWGQKGNSA